MKKFILSLLFINIILSQSYFISYGVNRSEINFNRIQNDHSSQDPFFGHGYTFGFGLDYKNYSIEFNYVKVKSSLVYRNLPDGANQINQNGSIFELPIYYKYYLFKSESNLYLFTGINFVLNTNKEKNNEFVISYYDEESWNNYGSIKSESKNSILFGIGTKVNNTLALQLRYLPKILQSNMNNNGKFITGLFQIKIDYYIPGK